jgi:hypothetical protein
VTAVKLEKRWLELKTPRQIVMRRAAARI